MVRTGKPKLIEINEGQLAAMVDYIKNHGDILALFIYGSHGTAYQTYFSDVDLAIIPQPGVAFDCDKEAAIMAELSVLGKSNDINLINLKNAPVTLQMTVLEDGRLLYSADDILLSDFVETVILRYSDFEPDLHAFYHDYDYGLKKEYL